MILGGETENGVQREGDDEEAGEEGRSGDSNAGAEREAQGLCSGFQSRDGQSQTRSLRRPPYPVR